MRIEEIDEDLRPLPGKSGPFGQSSTMNERLSLTIQSLRDLTKTIKDLDKKNSKLAWTVAFLSLLQVIQVIDVILKWIKK